jgi:hypothetical protein
LADALAYQLSFEVGTHSLLFKQMIPAVGPLPRKSLMTSSTWGWGEGFAAAKFAALFNLPFRPDLVDDPRLDPLAIERAIGILWHDQELGKDLVPCPPWTWE